MPATTKHFALISVAGALAALTLGGCSFIESKRYQAREEKPGIQLERLTAPPGYAVSVFARDVPGAREMALGADGWVFVGSTEGNVYALRLAGGAAAPARTILTGFGSSGIAYANGSLFVGDRSQVRRYDNIAAAMNGGAKGVVILDGLPSEKRHSARFMAIGPDGKLYVSIGAPCDTCEAANDEHSTILRVNTDGTGRELVARGIRNTVGFDWHPATRELWFTDNGSDNLGPDQPHDELNRVSRTGEHFGFPYCHAGTIADPKFGAARRCAEFTGPAARMGVHTAVLGMRFLRGDAFPASLRDSIVVARHGSHPPTRTGYDVVRVKVEGGSAGAPEPFLTGFLQGREYWGRPADVLALADGSVLVADDLNGAIYRVARK